MKRRESIVRMAVLALIAALSVGGVVGRPVTAARPVEADRVQAASSRSPVVAGHADIRPAGAGVDGIWSSGWVPIAPGQTLAFDHNLGGAVEDYQVQLRFANAGAGGLGAHTLGYGGLEGDGLYSGAYWQNLTPTSIEVVRGADDATIDWVRVWIWTVEPADYCTAWSNINQGDSVTVSHNLGGDVDDYSVLLWFKDTDTGRIHQQGYGGLEVVGERRGAYWRSLDTQFVSARRYLDDPYVDQVRVCVSVVEEAPDYDSGWLNIAQGETLTLTHGVGGNANGYIVNMEFKHVSGSLGIHHAGAGGDFLDPQKGPETVEHGAHWQRLTNDTIEVVRQQYDPYVDQVRVRIWQRTVKVYLPVVEKGY